MKVCYVEVMPGLGSLLVVANFFNFLFIYETWTHFLDNQRLYMLFVGPGSNVA